MNYATLNFAIYVMPITDVEKIATLEMKDEDVLHMGAKTSSYEENYRTLKL